MEWQTVSTLIWSSLIWLYTVCPDGVANSVHSLIWLYTVCPDRMANSAHSHLEQSYLALHLLRRRSGKQCPLPSGAVWSGSTWFAQTEWQTKFTLIWSSLIWLYTVCPDRVANSVHSHLEQSDLGLHCLPRRSGKQCPLWSGVVWSGSTLFAQTEWQTVSTLIWSSLIWVYTVSKWSGKQCPLSSGAVWSGSTLFPNGVANSVLSHLERSDLALHCLPRQSGKQCPLWSGAVWSGSTLFAQTEWQTVSTLIWSSLIWLYTVCPDGVANSVHSHLEQSDLAPHCLPRHLQVIHNLQSTPHPRSQFIKAQTRQIVFEISC